MGDVQFRRINGRVVPIRINPQQKRAAKLGAAAAGTAIGTGIVSGSFERNAAHALNESKRFRFKMHSMTGINDSRARRAVGQFRSLSKKNRAMNIGFSKAARVTKIGGTAAGGALLGAAAGSLLTKNEKNKDRNAIGGAVAASTISGLQAAGIPNPMRHISAVLVRTGNYMSVGKLHPMKAMKLAIKRVAAKGFKF